MSTDRQRVKRAIQRIAVQAPELSSLLSDAESKGGKPKSAGVGGGAGSGGGGDAQADRVCCDGSVSDDGNPGVGERDPDSGGQDGGLDGDDPARLDSGEGTLSGVTDCATGEPVIFSGAGFIPPDGWDAPNDPPEDPYYDSRYYFDYIDTPSSTTLLRTNSCSQVAALFLEDFDELCPQPTTATVDSICSNLLSNIEPAFSCGGTSRIIERRSCSSSVPECDEPATLGSWPSDGAINLAIVNGKIVGSKYDPENDGSYSAPRDSIDLCSGTDQISLAPAANGGWKTINSTNDSGYLYDSSGKVIAHIDGNEYSDPAI